MIDPADELNWYRWAIDGENGRAGSRHVEGPHGPGDRRGESRPQRQERWVVEQGEVTPLTFWPVLRVIGRPVVLEAGTLTGWP